MLGGQKKSCWSSERSAKLRPSDSVPLITSRCSPQIYWEKNPTATATNCPCERATTMQMQGPFFNMNSSGIRIMFPKDKDLLEHELSNCQFLFLHYDHFLSFQMCQKPSGISGCCFSLLVSLKLNHFFLILFKKRNTRANRSHYRLLSSSRSLQRVKRKELGTFSFVSTFAEASLAAPQTPLRGYCSLCRYFPNTPLQRNHLFQLLIILIFLFPSSLNTTHWQILPRPTDTLALYLVM